MERASSRYAPTIPGDSGRPSIERVGTHPLPLKCLAPAGQPPRKNSAKNSEPSRRRTPWRGRCPPFWATLHRADGDGAEARVGARRARLRGRHDHPGRAGDGERAGDVRTVRAAPDLSADSGGARREEGARRSGGKAGRPCRRRWSNASGGSVPRARVSPRSLTGSTLIACRPRKVGASGIRRRSATWRHAAPFRPEHRLPESDARALEPYDHTRDLRARVRGDGARRADGAADGGGVRGGAAVSRGCAACIAQAADGLVSGGVSAAEAVEASSRRRSGPGVRGIYLSVLSQVDAARPRLYAAKLQDHEAA